MVEIGQKTCLIQTWFLKSLSKFAFWLKWDAPKVYSFGPFSDPIYRRTSKNIAKNQNFCKNNILKNIKCKSQVPEKSQNSCEIKQKKVFWGVQIGSKLPPSHGTAPKGH